MCNIKDKHIVSSIMDIKFQIKPTGYLLGPCCVYIPQLKIAADQGCSAKRSIKI